MLREPRARPPQLLNAHASFSGLAPSPPNNTVDQGRSTPTSAGGLGGRVTASDTLLGMKNARKRAEADVQLLANRLAHLKFEEQRAHKKIHETERKTAELLNVRKKQANTNHERYLHRDRKKAGKGHAKSKATSQRHEQRKGTQASRQYMEDQRKAAADAQRQHKKTMEEYKKRQRAAEEREKREKREKVRSAARALAERRERERQEREDKMRREYARRMREETSRQREAEKLIAQLEQEEAEMLDRLRRTQDRQRGAYESLQRTISVGVGVTVDASVGVAHDDGPLEGFTEIPSHFASPASR